MLLGNGNSHFKNQRSFSFCVSGRYSQFRALWKKIGPLLPDFKFPPKHIQSSSLTSSQSANRQKKLQDFIAAAVDVFDCRCGIQESKTSCSPQHQLLLEFLELDGS